jgi:hypothetical protein
MLTLEFGLVAGPSSLSLSRSLALSLTRKIGCEEFLNVDCRLSRGMGNSMQALTKPLCRLSCGMGNSTRDRKGSLGGVASCVA